MWLMKKMLGRIDSRAMSLMDRLICAVVWLIYVIRDLVFSSVILAKYAFTREKNGPYTNQSAQGIAAVILLMFLGFVMYGYVDLMRNPHSVVLGWTVGIWTVSTLAVSCLIRFYDIQEILFDEEEDMAGNWT